MIDLGFDGDGDLFVLEIDHDGFLGGEDLGALHSVNGLWRGSTLVAGRIKALVENDPDLPTPGGIAVKREERVFVTTNATSVGDGRVVRISLDD